jgi:hypothetical protein
LLPSAAPATAPPPVESFSAPLFGVQPLPPPGPGTEILAVPPPPSQSHLPAEAPPAAPTAAARPFELHPSVSFSEQYSDNFEISSSNKIDNFRSTISPGLLVGINGPRTRGTVSASLGVAQDSIRRFGDFSFFPSVSASVRHQFDPRLTVSLSDAFSRSDEPALGNQFGLQQRRQPFTSNTLSLSADWLLDRVATQGYYQLATFFGESDSIANILGADAGIRLGRIVAVRAGYEFSQIHTSGLTTSDSTGHLIWASVARQISPLRSVGVSTSYSVQSLDNTRIGNVSLFTAYELPGRISLSGSLGVGFLSSDAGGDFTTMTSSTSASYRFAKAVIGVAILQDFNQTGLQGQDFGVVLTRSYTGTFSYALTPFVDTTLRASYSENQFTGVGNSRASPDTKTLSAQASLAWRIRPWLTAGLDYTYTRYNSAALSTIGNAVPANNVRGNATENRVALRLTSSF